MEGISGCGLGLRREFLFDVENYPTKPDWFEIAPENWIKTPKKLLKEFERIVAEHEIVCHGLSLSIGSLDDLDLNFLKDLKTFLDKYEIKHYSEHISFSSLENVQTYELLPIPMTKDMIKHITERVDFIQNFLKRELILENATYYYVPQSDMSEIEFINGVIKESGAKLLLDVNNVFVNGHNHNFDPKKFIDSLDKDSISYYHVAGHLEQSDGLWIDTHGMKVKEDVWDLLEYMLKQKKAPVLLERDNNIPSLKALMREVDKSKEIYERV